eukprot:gene13510-14920_t
MFEQELVEFDSEMGLGEFKDEFSALLDYDLFTPLDNLSPPYSCDSGVDIILDEAIDVESIGADELSAKTQNATIASEFSAAWEFNNETGVCEDTVGEEERQHSVKKDHCYSSKEISAEVNSCEFNVNQTSRHTFSNAKEKNLSKKEHKAKFVINDKERNGHNGFEKEHEPCNNKNAVMARLNRQRKKRYVENLEFEVSHLRQQNKTFAIENKKLKDRTAKCDEEISYLKGILHNQSMLSSVIKAVSSVPGITLAGTVSTSDDFESMGDSTAQSPSDKNNTVGGQDEKFSRRKRQLGLNDVRHCKKKNHQSNGAKNARAGICLHVSSKNVSVEYCHHCSRHASKD